MPPVQNAEIAAVLNEIADLLDIQGANPFRIRAYRNAARTMSEVGRSVAAMVAQDADLDALPGIGPDLAGKIIEIVTTGTCALLERLRKELPCGITELLKVPGLGPKRIRALHHELGVQTREQLHRAAQEGRVQAIPGFGPKTQQAILEATAARLHEERAPHSARGGGADGAIAARSPCGGAWRCTCRCRRQPATAARDGWRS